MAEPGDLALQVVLQAFLTAIASAVAVIVNIAVVVGVVNLLAFWKELLVCVPRVRR